jgi:hypothetical protein
MELNLYACDEQHHKQDLKHINIKQACWPNGKALDYESRDCRFDPCVGHQLPVHFIHHEVCGFFVVFLGSVLVVGLVG